LAARVACEAAVVKNKPLRPEEMTELVRQLKQTQNPYTCPHGRPIVLAYSLEELERKFGRR
jgi:DNA mismatch repair protein MutL